MSSVDQPYMSPGWWPCFNVPGDKATADIYMTFPDWMTGVSNGLLQSEVDNGDGTKTAHWYEQPQQIWRLDGPQRFPVQLTGGEDATGLAAVSPDGTFLVVQRDRGGEEYPGLYRLSPEGGALEPIQHEPRVQTFAEFVSHDSRWVYFRANDRKPDSFAIYRWDRKARVKETVFDQDGLWSVADHRPDGRLLLLRELGSAQTEIHEWDPARRVLSAVIGVGEKEEYDARYGSADGEVLVLTPRLGEFRRLYRLRAGKLEPVTPDVRHDVAGFVIDDDRRRIVYTVNEDGYTRMQLSLNDAHHRDGGKEAEKQQHGKGQGDEDRGAAQEEDPEEAEEDEVG